MNQILTQIQEEFDKDCPWLGSTYEQDAKNRKWVSDFLTQSNQRVLEKVNQLVLPKVQKFIDKVESGRARSKETYSDMKEIRDFLSTLIEQK